MWHTPRFPGRILFPRAIAARPARGAHLTGAGPPSSGWSAWKIARCSAPDRHQRRRQRPRLAPPGDRRRRRPGDTIVFAKKVHNITLTSGELDDHQEPRHRGSGRQQADDQRQRCQPGLRYHPGETVTIAGLTITHGLADGRLAVKSHASAAGS